MLKFTLIFGILLSGSFLFSQISFTESTSNQIEGVWYFGAVDFSDIDGDHDLDLLIGGRDNNENVVTRLYTNDGAGIFTEMVDNPLEPYFQGSLNFADFDSDGDHDIFLTGDWSGEARMYKNDGLGLFTEITGTLFGKVSYNANVFFDMDNDNDLDLLISGRRSNDFSPISKLYENDGEGNFTLKSGTPFEAVRRSAAAYADVDGDNDLDIIIGGENDANINTTKLYLNDGIGNFSLSLNNPFHGIESGAIKFADIDNDNDQDVFVSNRLESKLYINDGLGNFAEKLNTSFNGPFMDIADVDGDGDLDIIYLGTGKCTLYTNDGEGNFLEIEDTPFQATSFGSITFADVDGDNDPDVLITGQDNDTDIRIAKLYINNSVISSVHNESKLGIESFVLFPNPTSTNTIFLKYNYAHIGPTLIKVFNIHGKQVKSQISHAYDNGQVITINTNNLPSGMYTVKVEHGFQFSFGKFIKTK